MSTVIAREGSLVTLPASPNRNHIIDQLLRYSAGAPFQCFRLKRGALYAAEVVGTIQIGKLRLSILPKSDLGDEERDKEFLLNLLRSAGYLGPKSVTSAASVRATSLDPLEAVLTELGREILLLLHKGVPRRYEEVETESEILRGRVDFGKLCRRLPGGDAKLPIRYTPLSSTNALTRTVRWVAESLMLMARSSEARRILGEVLTHLEYVSGRRPTRADVHTLTLSRYEKSWARTVEIAQLLMDGKFIDPTFAGRTDAFGMLFPLQHLFERTLRGILAEGGKELGLSVTHRSEPLHMLRDASDASLLRLKPDYVFLRTRQPVMLGDAKWKRLSKDARAHGVERADIYQMNAYLTRYQIDRGALFVPRMHWMEPGWHKRFTIPPANQNIHLVSIDIEKLVSHVRTIRNEARKNFKDILSITFGSQIIDGTTMAGNQLDLSGAQSSLGI
jgi:5-methylcytosine-specific restriction enzyme subunit McrC